MSTIKIEDIAHVRFAAPDLKVMKVFLGEFGLIEVPSSDGVLYARGTGPQPFVHAGRPVVRSADRSEGPARRRASTICRHTSKGATRSPLGFEFTRNAI
jgi:hypothetical protein